MRDPNEKRYASFYERWEWLITFMVVEDRFVHNVLMAMDKRCNNSIGTMGVRVEGTRIYLEYSEKFIEELSDAELRFIITHEIYHVVLHHCTVRLPMDKEDRSLYNKAADMAINCLIPQTAERSMPIDKNGKPMGLLPKQFDFPDKLSMEQYVQLLREQESNDPKNKIAGDGDGFDSHDGWSESEVIKEIIRSVVNKLASDERAWGKMPGDVKALILAAQKSYVSWERYLKHFIGLMVSPTMTSTMKRPDRRFGYPYPGKKRGYTDRKLVCVDSSGSVGEDELSQFLAEINRLAEIHPVDLLVFDHDIQYGPAPFDRRQTSFDFPGRGGTSFNEVFKLASERHYQSVIMLTDGGAAAPEYPEGVRDVLWVLTGNGNPPVEWGERVRIIPKGLPQSQE